MVAPVHKLVTPPPIPDMAEYQLFNYFYRNFNSVTNNLNNSYDKSDKTNLTDKGGRLPALATGNHNKTPTDKIPTA